MAASARRQEKSEAAIGTIYSFTLDRLRFEADRFLLHRDWR
jgi:hypothetical protein